MSGASGSGPFDDDFRRVMRLGYAYREAKTLLSAVELDVFTALSGQALDAEALRLKLGIDQRGARDFFDALVALDLLTRDVDGLYGNTPAAALYLDRGKPTYAGYELEFINDNLYGKWGSLTEALRTGQPQTQAGSSGPYASRYRDAGALSRFASAMTAATAPVAEALAAKFPWQKYQTFMDIGCAEGRLPVRLAQTHLHLRGGGSDLPPMAPYFEAYVERSGLSERLTFSPGDFLQMSLPAAEVLILGRVLHNWDLQTKKRLLKKAYDALPADGCVIVYERFIDDDRRSSAVGLLSSLNMLLMTPGGFDFTVAECCVWLREAGFSGIRSEPLTQDQTMIAAIK